MKCLLKIHISRLSNNIVKSLSLQIVEMALTRKRKFYEWFNLMAIVWIFMTELLLITGKLKLFPIILF